MIRISGLIICLVILVTLVLPGAVQSQPNVCGFYGFVTLNGSTVPDGTVVRAWVNLAEVRSATTINSQYNMYVVGHYPDLVVTFTVGESQFVAAQTAVWEAGANKSLNLNASSSPPAPLQPQLTVSPEEGIMTTVSGDGFVPMFVVELTWEGNPISTVPNPVIVNTTGGFSAIILAPTSVPGAYTIAADDGAGSTAEASFTVVSLNGRDGEPGADGEPGERGADGQAGPKGDDGGSAGVVIAIIALIISLAIAALWLLDRRARGRGHHTV